MIGSAVVSGDESSPLVRALRYESAIKMPPTSKLPEDAIDAIVSWVRMGAPWPGYEPIQAEEGLPEGPVESDHWAFQPLSRPQVPDVGASRWLRNDIDRFVLARLRENGIKPSFRGREADTPATGDVRPARTGTQRRRSPRLRRGFRSGPALQGWSSGSWHRPATANAGGVTGWTWPATRTLRGWTRITRSGIPGGTATM